MLSKHTCNNPEHKKDAMLSRAVLAILIVVTFNTFTCAFLLINMLMLANRPPASILLPTAEYGLRIPTQDKLPKGVTLGEMVEIREAFEEAAAEELGEEGL